MDILIYLIYRIFAKGCIFVKYRINLFHKKRRVIKVVKLSAALKQQVKNSYRVFGTGCANTNTCLPATSEHQSTGTKTPQVSPTDQNDDKLTLTKETTTTNSEVVLTQISEPQYTHLLILINYS